MANPPQNVRRCSWLKFGYDKDTDSINDTRNVLLVVTALISAVTFQAGPGGVWQDDKEGHKAGSAIYSSQRGPFYAFLVCNSLAFSTSILVLTSLTYKFPFFIELWAAILAMCATYIAAIFAIVPDGSVDFRFLVAISAMPFGIRLLAEIYKWFVRKCKL